MPEWVAAYFALYIAFSLWSLTNDLKGAKEPTWHVGVEALCDVLLITAALSFWLGPVDINVDVLLLSAFLVGSGGVALLMLKSLRTNALDPALPLKGKVFVAVSGTLLSAAHCGLLLYWGFLSTVLHRYAGT